jgi:hypothetical protein
MISEEILDLEHNLENVYMYTEYEPETTGKIYLKYKYTTDKTFLRFEEEIKWSVYFDKIIDHDSKSIIVVFNIPDYFKKDYELILQGKFSETSKDYKETVVDFHDLTEYSHIYGVLYKKEFAFENLEERINGNIPYKYWVRVPREQEAASLFEKEAETLKKSKVALSV